MTADESVPPPFLFNAWKHHAGEVRRRVAAVATRGEPALARLPNDLLVVGTDLMDFYLGELRPAEVAAGLRAELESLGLFGPEEFARWVGESGGYRVTAAADGTRWALRHGDRAGRHVHIHPGRGSPLTVRVRANTLRTAIMATSVAAVRGGDPRDPALVVAARKEFLGLPPVRGVAEVGGLGDVLDLLAG